MQKKSVHAVLCAVVVPALGLSLASIELAACNRQNTAQNAGVDDNSGAGRTLEVGMVGRAPELSTAPDVPDPIAVAPGVPTFQSPGVVPVPQDQDVYVVAVGTTGRSTVISNNNQGAGVRVVRPPGVRAPGSVRPPGTIVPGATVDPGSTPSHKPTATTTEQRPLRRSAQRGDKPSVPGLAGSSMICGQNMDSIVMPARLPPTPLNEPDLSE